MALPIQCSDFLFYAVWVAGPTTGSHGKPRATLGCSILQICTSGNQNAASITLPSTTSFDARSKTCIFLRAAVFPFPNENLGDFSFFNDSMPFLKEHILMKMFEDVLSKFFLSMFLPMLLCEVAGRSYALQIQVLNSAIYESQQHDNFRRRSTNDSKHRQHPVFAIYLLHES